MKSRIDEIKQRIGQHENAAQQAKLELAAIQDNCGRDGHKWGPVKYDPIYHEAYTIPGDEPGTMGVDFRGPCHVPAETKPRWKRECSNCRLVQETTYTKPVTIAGRVPGTTATAEEPVFYGDGR